ncbi:hypothetical protein AJ79_01576 [Helicocarpus griseus UAMH5409]|uniref:Uncharacterized protein n=1 Tax=Helicocarpus griseus UAMH5409 TaxID=1447875 RepID=A0A2B7Y6P2_9EURO|nr:hypothetical protein AJ79_01576 [Helicocarpus griseus UAMH5409]
MSESTSSTTSPDTSSSALASDGTAPLHKEDASVFTSDGSNPMPPDVALRRRSIQFDVAPSVAQLSRKRADTTRKNSNRNSLQRIPSPPPPSTFCPA